MIANCADSNKAGAAQGFATGLDAVHSRLAVEAVGKKHVGDDPRAAIFFTAAGFLCP
jgi:hypothetical protein